MSKKGGRYVQHGDYLFPDPTLPEEGHWTIGKYGRMRHVHQREHHPELYSRLILSGKLNEHLSEVERTCQEWLEKRLERIKRR